MMNLVGSEENDAFCLGGGGGGDTGNPQRPRQVQLWRAQQVPPVMLIKN